MGLDEILSTTPTIAKDTQKSVDKPVEKKKKKKPAAEGTTTAETPDDGNSVSRATPSQSKRSKDGVSKPRVEGARQSAKDVGSTSTHTSTPAVAPVTAAVAANKPTGSTKKTSGEQPTKKRPATEKDVSAATGDDTTQQQPPKKRRVASGDSVAVAVAVADPPATKNKTRMVVMTMPAATTEKATPVAPAKVTGDKPRKKIKDVAPATAKQIPAKAKSSTVSKTMRRDSARTKKSAVETPKKKRRFRAGTVALREIRKVQRGTDLLGQKLPFQRVIRDALIDVTKTTGKEFRVQASAVLLLQESYESFMVSVLQDAMMMTTHAKRVTLCRKDIEPIVHMRKVTVEFDKKLIITRPAEGEEPSSHARHRHLRTSTGDVLLNIRTSHIRRMCRRAGVKTISEDVYDAVRIITKGFMQKVMPRVTEMINYSQVMTVTVRAVSMALSQVGLGVYGGGFVQPKRKVSVAASSNAEDASSSDGATQLKLFVKKCGVTIE
jgi:histone H3-like centromeric protein A